MKGHWIIVEHNGEPMTLRELAAATGIPHSTLANRWHRGTRGDALVAPVEKKPAGFVFFCDVCQQEFHRPSRGYRYCSRVCANKARAISKQHIERYALKGLTASYICLRLGCDLNTLRRAMKAHGLYRAWQLARFKKCASLKVGSQSTTTRVVEANSPSAPSA